MDTAVLAPASVKLAVVSRLVTVV